MPEARLALLSFRSVCFLGGSSEKMLLSRTPIGCVFVCWKSNGNQRANYNQPQQPAAAKQARARLARVARAPANMHACLHAICCCVLHVCCSLCCFQEIQNNTIELRNTTWFCPTPTEQSNLHKTRQQQPTTTTASSACLPVSLPEQMHASPQASIRCFWCVCCSLVLFFKNKHKYRAP